ncbi:MAG: response regulator transcription factor [Microscillaceae bacterium]|nr:response regulator transcription factor [Microscillaceae bacterium]MDW8460533.1 response regulator transcription factor [Cytophagales bacterium]
MIKYFIADDHNLFRQGIILLLSKQGFECRGEFNKPQELLSRLAIEQPDIVLCDITFPDYDGMELAETIKKNYPNVKVAILSTHKEYFYVSRAVELQLEGYFHKDVDLPELVRGIQKILKGDKFYCSITSQIVMQNILNTSKKQIPTLTAKEKEVLKLLSEGNSSRKISEILKTSVRTIDNHRAALLKKFQLRKTTEMVKFAIENNII